MMSQIEDSYKNILFARAFFETWPCLLGFGIKLEKKRILHQANNDQANHMDCTQEQRVLSQSFIHSLYYSHRNLSYLFPVPQQFARALTLTLTPLVTTLFFALTFWLMGSWIVGIQGIGSETGNVVPIHCAQESLKIGHN